MRTISYCVTFHFNYNNKQNAYSLQANISVSGLYLIYWCFFQLGLPELESDTLHYAAYLNVLGNEMRYWFIEAEDIIDFINNSKDEAYSKCH